MKWNKYANFQVNANSRFHSKPLFVSQSTENFYLWHTHPWLPQSEKFATPLFSTRANKRTHTNSLSICILRCKQTLYKPTTSAYCLLHSNKVTKEVCSRLQKRHKVWPELENAMVLLNQEELQFFRSYRLH